MIVLEGMVIETGMDCLFETGKNENKGIYLQRVFTENEENKEQQSGRKRAKKSETG